MAPKCYANTFPLIHKIDVPDSPVRAPLNVLTSTWHKINIHSIVPNKARRYSQKKVNLDLNTVQLIKMLRICRYATAFSHKASMSRFIMFWYVNQQSTWYREFRGKKFWWSSINFVRNSRLSGNSPYLITFLAKPYKFTPWLYSHSHYLRVFFGNIF